MRIPHPAVLVVTGLVLVVLMGHVCPVAARTVEVPRTAPMSGPHDEHGHRGHHDHHDSHLSSCLPGAVLPDSGAPVVQGNVTAEVATSIMTDARAPGFAYLREPTPDGRRLRPPLYILNTALLI